MADLSIPQGCAHGGVSARGSDFKVNDLRVISKKYFFVLFLLLAFIF